MTHSAGFAYEMWNKLTDAWTAQTGLARIETFRRPEDCMPLVFDPGTSWAYGIGLEWAGKLLEAVSGETLDAYMQQHVAKPLGMNSTGYELRPEIAARLAGMHQRHPDGKLEAIPFDPPQDPESFLGGGGLYSTVGDYVRFIDMILNEGALDGARILKPETVAMMRENHLGDVDVLPLEAAQPLMTNDADFFPGMQQKWGLSFLINTRDVPGRRRAGSLAWAGLRNTYYWIDPKTKIGGTIMTQMLPFADRTVLDLLEAFEREVYRL
jgi:CubicO group peptidase (beta-lactamase class C family)